LVFGWRIRIDLKLAARLTRRQYFYMDDRGNKLIDYIIFH
jgi:hypothetical protein